jgi:hypothetical protein
VDRHRFDADPKPEPSFHFDADPEPEPSFHFVADPVPDRTPSFTHVGKSYFCYFNLNRCQFTLFCLFLQCHRLHIIFCILDSLFWYNAVYFYIG